MKLLPFAMLALVACTTSSNTMEGYAPEAVFHDEIGNCFAAGACVPLCVKLFAVDPFDLASCGIIARDPGGARVRGVLVDDGGSDVTDDGSDDDSSDPVDDPPPDDPPPDDPPPDDPPPDDGSGSDALRIR